LYKKAFKAKIIEYYGSAEMGVMAFQRTSKRSLWLCEDLTYFEFLNKDGNPIQNNELGRIVVTDLNNTTMPFIRYDQGDFAEIEINTNNNIKEISIKRIIGRDNDYITLSDRTTRPYNDFYVVMNKFQNVWQFRVFQKSLSDFQIKIAAEPEYFEKIKQSIIDLLKNNFPNNCSFELIRVDFIDPDINGKLRMIISEINNK